MLEDLKAPRELILLVRIVALLGATKIASVAYYDLLAPTPPTAAEVAASEREIRHLSDTGEARVLADFRKRAPGVWEAAQKCMEKDQAACRWAEIWVERYQWKAHDVLRTPQEYDAPAELFRRAQEAESPLEPKG